MGEVNLAANQKGLYVLSGGSDSVSYGGCTCDSRISLYSLVGRIA